MPRIFWLCSTEMYILFPSTCVMSSDPPSSSILVISKAPNCIISLLIQLTQTTQLAPFLLPSLPPRYKLGIYGKRRNRCEMSPLATGLSQSNAACGARQPICIELERIGDFHTFLVALYVTEKQGVSFPEETKYCGILMHVDSS